MGGSKSKPAAHSARSVLAQRTNEALAKAADGTIATKSRNVTATETSDKVPESSRKSLDKRIDTENKENDSDIDASVLNEISKWSAVVSSDSPQQVG